MINALRAKAFNVECRPTLGRPITHLCLGGLRQTLLKLLSQHMERWEYQFLIHLRNPIAARINGLGAADNSR